MGCRICGNGIGNRHHTAAEMMFGTREPFDYVECVGCGCLQIAEYPPDVGKYYGPGYYSYDAGLKPTTFFERLSTRMRDRYAVGGRNPVGRYLYGRRPNRELAHLAPALRHRGQRILDVGCGSAALLRSLDAIGFHEVFGADLFIDAAFTFGRRGRVDRKSLEQIDGSFDVVMLHHSLEHMPDQPRAFGQIARLLSPGGTAVVAVPLAASYAWEHYGVDWVQLDAPRHFYLHSPESLRLLAAGAGLRVVRTVYDSTPFQFWGSEQYRRGIALQAPESLMRTGVEGSIFTAAAWADFNRRSIELNATSRGDQAIFFLERA